MSLGHKYHFLDIFRSLFPTQVLQCVAACCSVLQSGAVCASVRQRVSMWCGQGSVCGVVSLMSMTYVVAHVYVCRRSCLCILSLTSLHTGVAKRLSAV